MNTDEYHKLSDVEPTMWYFQSLHGHIRRELVQAKPDVTQGVLDAGCGTGGLTERLRQWWPEGRFSGVDFSGLACELARERCGDDVDIREASICAMPFKDESFSVVIAADVMSQVDDREEAMRELFRVLRPGGLFIVNVPAYMWMWSYHDDNCHTKHRFTRSEMRTLVENVGGRVSRVTHWNALPFPAIFAKRKLFSSKNDTSDVKRYPALIEAGFNGLMKAEHAWIRAGGNWAWGTSVLAVASKSTARAPAQKSP